MILSVTSLLCAQIYRSEAFTIQISRWLVRIMIGFSEYIYVLNILLDFLGVFLRHVMFCFNLCYGAHKIITLQIEFIKCLLVWAFCCCSSRFDLCSIRSCKIQKCCQYYIVWFLFYQKVFSFAALNGISRHGSSYCFDFSHICLCP